MIKRICCYTCIFALITALIGGCTPTANKKSVSLTLWAPSETQELMKELTEEFTKAYKDEANITVHLGVESEATLSDNIIDRPSDAADVYHFADDQMSSLINAGALLPISENTEFIIDENGGRDSNAVKSAMYNGQLYAYPLTASNGYFMFYNAQYFSESDVETFDKILDIAEQNGKYVAMDWTSGWYLYSFFGGAGLGLSLSEDGTTNICDWNSVENEYKGVDVAQAMINIASRKSFVNIDDDKFKEGVENGSIIAGVNGPWNAGLIQKAWGENYRAVKLPTYTVKENQVQMAAFIGYKLIGVNAYTKEPEWAMRLAEWISNYDSQLKRFETTGELPSNVKAAHTDEVLSSQVVKALTEQMPYSVTQRVANSFWNPATTLGVVMASGNPDNMDLQKLLDDFVEKVTTIRG